MSKKVIFSEQRLENEKLEYLLMLSEGICVCVCVKKCAHVHVHTSTNVRHVLYMKDSSGLRPT